MRRFLTRVAVGGPGLFRGAAKRRRSFFLIGFQLSANLLDQFARGIDRDAFPPVRKRIIPEAL